MKLIKYSDIDSSAVELSCHNGIPEIVEIQQIPKRFQSQLSKLKMEENLLLPEKYKKCFSVVCHEIKGAGDELSLQIKIRFQPCSFLCQQLKQTGFNFILFEKQLVFHFTCGKTKSQNVKQAMIALDLGNTRTCAVVCPDITNISMNKLKLAPHYLKLTDTKAESATFGVWDSVCVMGKSEAFKDSTASFVRIGDEYKIYLRDGQKGLSGHLRSLSTPKRYFWDDEEDRNWALIRPTVPDAHDLKHQDDIELAKVISNRSYHGKYPKAMIVEGTVYELLEQAERMLNKTENYIVDQDDETLKQWHSSCYHQISHFVMTYPAAWSPEEVETYKKVVQRGIDYFVSQRCGNQQIKLHMECNEATSVLVNYIYSEAHRFGSGEKWLKLVGKSDTAGVHTAVSARENKSLRLAVIDIGGGTSDLAIAEVSWDSVDNATKISTCYTYGTNEAGDALIARIIKDFIFDKVFKKMVKDTLKNQKKREELRTYIIRNVLPEMKRYTREFWFKLTVMYLEQAELGDTPKITLYDKNKTDDTFYSMFAGLLRATNEKLMEEEDDSLKKLAVYLEDFSVMDKNVDIEFTVSDKEKYKDLLKSNFKFSPLIFGAAIAAYQCDMVIWSGKTSENRGIRELFEEQIPVPPSAFISMNNYKLTSNNSPLVGLDGTLTDSKYATAIGAGLYSMLKIRNDQHFSLIIRDAAGKQPSYWGLSDANGIFEPFLSPNESESKNLLQYNGTKGLLIYRANSNSPLAFSMPAYEFRSKPDAQIQVSDTIKFSLRQSDGKLDFQLQGGTFTLSNGTPLTVDSPGAKDYFELRLRMIGEEEIWLDTGKLF